MHAIQSLCHSDFKMRSKSLVHIKTSNSSSKTRGAAAPRTRITCELFGKQKNPVRVHTHTHTQPTKNIPYTHVAVDTNIVVFRPSEPHQYSINFLHKCVHAGTHAHTQTSISQ